MSKNTPQRNKNGNNRLIQSTFQHFSSPYPTPQMLEGFEKIVPGSAEKVMNRSLDAIDRSLKLKEEGQKASIHYETIRLYGALGIVSLALIGGFALVFVKGNVVSYSILIGEIATLVFSFFYSQKK